MMIDDMSLEFEELYQEHYDKLFRAAFRLTGKKEDAEDVIQESFINAYKAFSRFNRESSFGTWIYRIMLNCAYKYIKQRKQLPVHEITQRNGSTETEFWESIKSEDSVEDSVIMEDVREMCFQVFLNCIPNKQRIAFTLKHLLELSVKDVAAIMGISESDVKISVYRAKQHLKNNMEDRCALLDAKNPCHCSYWMKYLIEHDVIDRIPQMKLQHKRKQIDFNGLVGELTFLRKIKKLYDNQPEVIDSKSFILKMKGFIEEGKLQVLK